MRVNPKMTAYNTHFTQVYKILRKRMEGSFPHSINDKHCLPFIINRMRKTSFHSLPSNSVHRAGVNGYKRAFKASLTSQIL